MCAYVCMCVCCARTLGFRAADVLPGDGASGRYRIDYKDLIISTAPFGADLAFAQLRNHKLSFCVFMRARCVCAYLSVLYIWGLFYAYVCVCMLYAFAAHARWDIEQHLYCLVIGR